MKNNHQKCEVVKRWEGNRIVEQCAEPAVASYPAMGGGRMYLCTEHVKPHARTSAAAKAIELRDLEYKPFGWTP